MTHANQRRIVVGTLAAGLLTASGCGSTSSTGQLAAQTSPAGSYPAASGVRQLTPDVTAQLDTAIKQVMKEANVPGVVVGLWIPPNGSYVRAFGVADKSTKAPMATDFYTRIGSVTKTFTVTGILQLVDQGKIGLDDPISKYISGVPSGDQITLRELAGMRSGLYNYTFDSGFQKAFFTDPSKPFTPQQLLAYAFKHPLVFKPGTQFEYVNTNLILLGLVVEKISGQPLHTYIQQHILTPSSLSHTVFPTGAEFPSPHAHGYTNQTLDGKVADATNWNPSWGWAAGAMISNLNDLKAWAPILATGSLLKPATQAQRLKGSELGSDTYGLGIFTAGGWIGHNGSLPGYQTLVFYLPSAKATMILFDNTDTSYEGHEPSTLFGNAITKIITPGNVYALPAQPDAPSSTPTTSASPGG